MKIVITNHAKKRMDSRRISEAEVKSTIRNAFSCECNSDGSISYFARYDNKLFQVVALKKKKIYLIKTAFEVK